MITAINICIKYIGSIYMCFKAKYPRTKKKIIKFSKCKVNPQNT